MEELPMTRVPVFNSPLLLGFEEFERALDRVSKHSSEGYPPYNIEQIGANALRITLAVAGFSARDLEVLVEDNQLVIRGRQGEQDGRTYLHRGIATRQFQRSFVLAEGLEVSGATLEHGLLTVDLIRPNPIAKVRRVEIRDVASGRPSQDVSMEGENPPTSIARVQRGVRSVPTK
jgi:HSP20 family molecular chaperone IbpA